MNWLKQELIWSIFFAGTWTFASPSTRRPRPTATLDDPTFPGNSPRSWSSKLYTIPPRRHLSSCCCVSCFLENSSPRFPGLVGLPMNVFWRFFGRAGMSHSCQAVGRAGGRLPMGSGAVGPLVSLSLLWLLQMCIFLAKYIISAFVLCL